jgi:hypothetical protein
MEECVDKEPVKLLPDELTDEQLELVLGGMQYNTFLRYRADILNNILERSRTAKQTGVIT